MSIDNDFRKFINISSKLSGNNILFITDLEKVILCSPQIECENSKISSDLLNYAKYNKKNILSSEYAINILHNYNPDYISQIILPIIIDNKLFGYFVSISNTIFFKQIHLDYANTTLYFIEKFINKNRK